MCGQTAYIHVCVCAMLLSFFLSTIGVLLAYTRCFVICILVSLFLSLSLSSLLFLSFLFVIAVNFVVFLCTFLTEYGVVIPVQYFNLIRIIFECMKEKEEHGENVMKSCICQLVIYEFRISVSGQNSE